MGLFSSFKKNKANKPTVSEIKQNEKVWYANKILYIGTSQLPLEKLLEVFVITNNKGLFEDDVFLELVFDELTISLSSEHPNHQTVLDSLAKDILIDYSNYINAMNCVDNAKFLLWKKTV